MLSVRLSGDVVCLDTLGTLLIIMRSYRHWFLPVRLIPANELRYSMCGVQCLSGDHDQVGVHSSRNVANSIHETSKVLLILYLSMNYT